jgi:hypothetical protein
MKRSLPILALCAACGAAGAAAAAEPVPFDDPMFRRCVTWLLTGERGALIGNICLGEYDLPPPSLFLCARKVQTGFASATDQEACALLLEEETRKVRAGFVR